MDEKVLETIKNRKNWDSGLFETYGMEFLKNSGRVREALVPMGLYEEFDTVLCHWKQTGEILNTPAAVSGTEQQEKEKKSFREYVSIAQEKRSFPILCLPAVLSEYTFAVSDSLQVPPDTVAVAVLSCLAAAVQGKYSIRITGSWIEPLNLYTIVVARPSERKSPVIKLAKEPIDSYVMNYNTEHELEIHNFERRCRILRKQIMAMEDQVSKLSPAGTENRKKGKLTYTMEDIEKLQKELSDLEKNPVKQVQILFDDVTPESLSLVLAQNSERAAIISAEGGVFGALAGRYSDKPNMDLFLKGYSGESYSTTRVGRKGENLSHPLLTMHLALQPRVIEDVMKNKDFRGRGLTARFLYSYPVSRIGSRELKMEPVNEQVKYAYDKCIQDFLAIPDNLGERELLLDTEAYKEFKNFYDWVEKALNSELEDIEEWGGKLVGNTARIAGLLHCAIYGRDAYNHKIERITMVNAIEIGQYFINHADTVFNICDSKETETVLYVLDKICSSYQKGSLKHSIKKRDLQRKCRKKLPEELDKYIDILQKNGYIRTEYVKNSGLTTVYYIVNPEYLQELED